MHRIRRLLLPIDSLGPADTVARVAQLMLGLFLYGIALALLVRASLGVGPWDVLSLGIANHLPMTYGTATVVVSGLVLLLWIPLRQMPGLGTVANVLVIGLATDVGLWLIPAPESLVARIPLLLGGVVLNGLAGALYIGAQLGPGPRDGLMTGLARRSRFSLRVVRTAIELTVLAIGFALGGVVGVGTVLYAVAIGPLVQTMLPWVAVRLSPIASSRPAPADPPHEPDPTRRVA